MNWKHYLGIGFGFILTAFIVNFALDYFGVSKYIYTPYSSLVKGTTAS